MTSDHPARGGTFFNGLLGLVTTDGESGGAQKGC